MKRRRIKIGPELTVEANRMADELAENVEWLGLGAMPEEFQPRVDTPGFMKITARRIEELKARGYPQAWIERDLEKLRGVL